MIGTATTRPPERTGPDGIGKVATRVLNPLKQWLRHRPSARTTVQAYPSARAPVPKQLFGAGGWRFGGMIMIGHGSARGWRSAAPAGAT
jgi:hypothetical protein